MGLFLSSFATSVGRPNNYARPGRFNTYVFAIQAWQLVALQGVVVGLSGGILYAPIVIWVCYFNLCLERSRSSALLFHFSLANGSLTVELWRGLLSL